MPKSLAEVAQRNFIEYFFTFMPKRRMSQIVRKRYRAYELGIESESFCYSIAYRFHMYYMLDSRTYVIALRRKKSLCFMF
ncbi:hypothetical protein SDC9_99938 [bioreactor metagenome]|uniref:Uncharacterized protein n=1 Tax=bioreactor metagenome TaxID=1076179 RepID=A0A645AQP6_9ZZZZ